MTHSGPLRGTPRLATAGRAEAAFPPRGLVELRRLPPVRLADRRDHQLGDAVAAADGEILLAQVDQDHLHLPAIVGVDGAGRVQAGDAGAQSKARAGPHLRFEAGGQGHGEAGGHRVTAAGPEDHRLVLRHGGAQVHARGVRGLVGRQRQPLAVRQPHDPDLDAHASSPAMRSARRRATSPFDAFGQGSTPCESTSSTSFSSPPMIAPSLTSLATIQSQPLRASLARASASRLPVSAANPTTSRGRAGPLAERVARMSGFSTSRMAGGPSLPFFSLTVKASSTRQSETAATQTAASTGSAPSEASSISRAVSTSTRSTPAGVGSAVGPVISSTSAPSPASAPAMA